MTVRNRYREFPISPDGDIREYFNGALSFTYGPQTVTTKERTERCEDAVGGEVNPLLITKSSARITRLAGTSLPFGSPGNQTIRIFNGRIPTLYLSHSIGHLSTSLPTEGSSLATLLARTNPGRSDVSLPTFIGELKDFPRMIREMGNIAIRFGNARRAGRAGGLGAAASLKDFANYYLGTVFGAMPMISDIRKLLQFSSLVDRRIAELQAMQRRGGLSRKRQLGSGVTSSSGNTTINSLGGTWTARYTHITAWRRWASTRWQLTGTIPTMSSNSRQARAYAARLCAGLNSWAAVETAWELLPWSWLADWFGKFGDLIAANNNSVPCIPVNSCVMTEISSHKDYHGVQTSTSQLKPISGGDATFTYVTKARYVGSASFNTNLPLLSGRQWSILGALAIQRRPR